ncbi:L domain-like protein [Dendrothele bispora CBS 962.96]|uniref:L domain-like protein n=1 Tax=Dendrothele bispora (strain CBS 962.96) TaxID=1314807 RepID=A0A4S8M6J6_DENBC|nr:L domain-like protein [Dendrothele bispora CBS 962.96]
MSRLPPPSTRDRSRSPMKPSPSPSKSRMGTTTPVRATTPVRTRTKSSTGPRKPVEKEEPPPTPTMSIKEQIALKRAEAKKAMTARSGGGDGGGLNDMSSLEDAIPGTPPPPLEEDILGRWSVRETIERARSSGSLNLSSRSLECLPPELYEIHLGITPDVLKLVPNPTPSPPSEPSVAQKRGKRDNPAWFEAQDLQTLKAPNNEILEIQHEISLFGSLKVIDLHKNKLSSLPRTFGDLASLTSLDLSNNALTSIPTDIFTFPDLTHLNLSHNQLTSLPFNEPFASGRKFEASGGSFFAPTVNRATSPLPRLANFDASYNKISADAIDLVLPSSLVKVNLSLNPLGQNALPLVKKLGSLPNLKELRFEKADIGDEAFPNDLTSTSLFPKLRILDLGETRASSACVQAALQGVQQEITLETTTEDPPEGVLRLTVGKKVYKEPWEIEAEKRAKAKAARLVHEEGINWGSGSTPGSGRKTREPAPAVEKEQWEIDAEQGLMSEGAKRRARAQAANAVAATTTNTSDSQSSKPAKPAQKEEVMKEAWEIEAEQGLLTEGGKRRARAQAAAAAAAADSKKTSTGLGLGEPSTTPAQSSSNTFSLSSPQYYNQSSQTLTLPASTPPSKAHSRAFSMAPSAASISPSTSTTDLVVPVPSAPVAEIAAQSFSAHLRVLILSNRRRDRTLTLPSSFGSALLPNLEELDLEGCNFSDTISVARYDPAASNADGVSPTRTTESLIPLLASLFPRLLSLNLSYNLLSSSSLTPENLSSLILAAPHKKGLKHLVLRGNKITELDGFVGLSEMFKGNRDVPGWKLDELDLRDNEIPKLPAEMGLLPLEVFLVDGNLFRAPPRRIWEREGTKGLLGWLRGRIE